MLVFVVSVVDRASKSGYMAIPFSSSLIMCLLLISLAASAQNPHISGDIYLSVKKGTIQANLEVSRLPSTTNYSLGLNSGFNIQHFTDSTGKVTYEAEREYLPEKSSESFQYWFPAENKKTVFCPNALK